MLTSMVSDVSFILCAQQLTKAPVQRQRQHLLDRPVRLMSLIVLASSRRTADHPPVRCPITGAAKTRGIHKRFQYVNRMRVTLAPIGRDPRRHPSQNVRGQMRHPHPRQDEKPRVVGDEMNVPLPCHPRLLNLPVVRAPHPTRPLLRRTPPHPPPPPLHTPRWTP